MKITLTVTLANGERMSTSTDTTDIDAMVAKIMGLLLFALRRNAMFLKGMR